METQLQNILKIINIRITSDKHIFHDGVIEFSPAPVLILKSSFSSVLKACIFHVKDSKTFAGFLLLLCESYKVSDK